MLTVIIQHDVHKSVYMLGKFTNIDFLISDRDQIPGSNKYSQAHTPNLVT